MAGRRRRRDTKEALVSRHAKRRTWFERDLQAARADPGEQVIAGAQYLRGALARTAKTVPGDAAAAARQAADYLAELADDLFRKAIEQRRKDR